MTDEDWVEKAEKNIIESLLKIAQHGSVPAASAALKVLSDISIAHIHEQHLAHIESMREDALALSEYLGEIGTSFSALDIYLGHVPTDDERQKYRYGALKRKNEIQAIELELAKRGKGKIEKWMRNTGDHWPMEGGNP